MLNHLREILLIAVIALQTAAFWYSNNRHEQELKIARGNYVLAVVYDNKRHLQCCRESEVKVPEMTPYHIELATAEEADLFLEEHGSGNHWVEVPTHK